MPCVGNYNKECNRTASLTYKLGSIKQIFSLCNLNFPTRININWSVPTVNPLIKPPPGLIFSSTFEGEGEGEGEESGRGFLIERGAY